jgi:ankyrin repeat protein
MPLLLLVGLAGSTALWLRAQQRQYALNRALIVALVKGDDKQAVVLVNAGADPNTRCELTQAPSLTDLVRQLLHRSLSGNDSPTAFMIACGGDWIGGIRVTFGAQRSRPDCMQLVQTMIVHHADVNAQDRYGWTSLLAAVSLDRRETVRVLIQNGANCDVKDKDHQTPLMEAIIHRSPTSLDTIRLLLEHGANANSQNKYGFTALNYAVGDAGLVALLKHYGAREPGKRP